MKPQEQKVAGQECWILENSSTRLSITKLGGMCAPVTFYRDTKQPVEPYYVSPWQEEGLKLPDPVLVPLRGNFFCAPFGADNQYKSENHATHGEPATALWSNAELITGKKTVTLQASMTTKSRPGTVTKRISLVEGQNVLYVQHVVEGSSGKMSLGYHATLAGDEREDAILLSFSPFQFGVTQGAPDAMSSHFAGGEYASLLPDAQFRNLAKVPTLWKEPSFDRCDSFPRRRGFADIVQIFSRQSKRPGWSAAVRPAEGYLWFALKDTAVLPSTVLWMENHGRHQAPWNGRNCCLGIEDVCSFRADGLRPSAARNVASEAGIATVATLSARKPTIVNYIEGVVRVPKGFDRVAKTKFTANSVQFTSESGKTVEAAVQVSFVHNGTLAE